MQLEIALITGMSGSGKSVALRALEDAGFYCVDNLPPELLLPFVALEHQHHGNRLAIAMDVRSATSLPQVDATTDTLVRRFSETRRRHPLFHGELKERQRALVQVIELERELLADLREKAHVIDTSNIRASQLQGYVKGLISSLPEQLSLVFQSFAFKRGIPMDADYVFDVRMLPNPHYEADLRDLTGQDKPVMDFLDQQADVRLMRQHIETFLSHWLESMAQNHRSYVTVAIGCTGGQHRSVYLVERLAQTFGDQWPTQRRHRELDGR